MTFEHIPLESVENVKLKTVADEHTKVNFSRSNIGSLMKMII